MSYEVKKFTKPVKGCADMSTAPDSPEAMRVFREQRCSSPEGKDVMAHLSPDFAARCASKIFNGGWLSEEQIAQLIREESGGNQPTAWSPIKELGEAKHHENGRREWKLFPGWEKFRLFAIEMADGETRIHHARITDDGTLHDENGNDIGWYWCDASYFMDIPEPPENKLPAEMKQKNQKPTDKNCDNKNPNPDTCYATLPIHPPTELPEYDGEILVALWGSNEWEIVNVRENVEGPFTAEYKNTGEPSDPDEWQWWADIKGMKMNDDPAEKDCANLMDRLDALSKKINWDCFCDEMENSLPELKRFLETWGRHFGTTYKVFRGQLCKTILQIWKENKNHENK